MAFTSLAAVERWLTLNMIQGGTRKHPDPEGATVEKEKLKGRDALRAQKLKTMTEANGCTPGEADNAKTLAERIQGDKAMPSKRQLEQFAVNARFEEAWRNRNRTEGNA